MSVKESILSLKKELPAEVTLIAVSKTKPAELILEAYHAGQLDFGENKVQELVPKYEVLPEDIRWHLIGHLQTNKVKYIAPFVHMIHSVDSEKLLAEINKQAAKNNRVIPVLLQIYIADEETKFGFSFEEAETLLNKELSALYPNITVQGLMGMATNTDDESKIRSEFRTLKVFFDQLSRTHASIKTLSMGMSSDWKIAVEEGSTMIRVGSALFGERQYH
ncbi:MAG: YggS family pyridoxal phosphate-dependent enzyme [Bacteroidia bacterium]